MTLILLVQVWIPISSTAHHFLISLGTSDASLPIISPPLRLSHLLEKPVRPRLALSNGGTVFVIYPDCVEIQSGRKKEIILLRDGHGDVPDFHVDKSRIWSGGGPDLALVLVEDSILSITFTMGDGGDAGIAAKLETAVVYGRYGGTGEVNPILFDLPVGGGVDEAIAVVCRRVIEGGVIPSLDTRVGIMERREAVGRIIHFLNDIGAGDRISRKGRYELVYVLEKVSAGLALFNFHLAQLDYFESRECAGRTIIDGLVISYLETRMDVAEMTRAECVDVFFNSHVMDVGRLIETCIPLETGVGGGVKALYEANCLLLIVLDSAMSYRREFAGALYGINDCSQFVSYGCLEFDSIAEPWTGMLFC
jgi:hypothetical protein